MLQPDLSTDERRALEASFKPDKFRGLRGPVAIPDGWERELNRIDSRMVLRWQPLWKRYAVFMRMGSGKLYSQPVHLIENDHGGCRPPNTYDLYLIRKAAWLARVRGVSAWIEHMDRTLAADQRAAYERQERLMDDGFDRLCRAGNLTVNSLGRTRKAVTSGRKLAGV